MLNSDALADSNLDKERMQRVEYEGVLETLLNLKKSIVTQGATVLTKQRLD